MVYTSCDGLIFAPFQPGASSLITSLTIVSIEEKHYPELDG
jgi:hypothetical protein